VLLAGGLVLLLAAGVPPQAAGQAFKSDGSASESTPSVRTGATTDAKAQARGKLLQARTQLGQGNFDSAEALAKEVAGMNLGYRPDEDSPAKVMKDIASARTDAKALLQAARSSLARKRYDQAEKYARLAEKFSGLWTFPMWGDTPSKALKDIAAARKASEGSVKKPAATASASTTAKPVERPAAPSSPPKADETEKARALLKQAREDLKAGKLEDAKKHTAQARALKANLSWVEDNPERIEAEIHKVESATPAKDKATASATNVPRTKQEAKDLLAQGRKQLADNKLDEAARTAQRIKALTTVSWGLFEDSPDRLQIDIDKERVKRDKVESVKVLAEARQLYEKGDYENASRLAYKAQKLHGSYSIMELGDRPTKLLAEIQTAQAKARKNPLPPAVASRNNTPSGTVPANSSPVVNSLASRTPQASQSASLPPASAPDARPGLQASSYPGLPSGIIPTAAAAATTGSDVQPAVANLPASAPAPAPNKLRAQQLIAEAQRFLKEGKLVEARLKAIDAQRLGARFSPDEVSPELVYQQVSVQARQRIDSLMRQAQDTASYGSGDAQSRYRAAVVKLNEAKQLAGAFGQDVAVVDRKLAEMVALQSAPAPTPLASAPPPPGLTGQFPTAPTLPPPVVKTPASTTRTDTSLTQAGHPTATASPSMGQTLLEKARLELKKGETATARRMTESAVTSYPECKDEAFALLRTIDAEESNQQRLAANRGFDAALSAFNRHEHARATAMIAAIDTRLLDAARQVRLREICMTPEMVALSGSAAKASAGVARKAPSTPVVQASATVPAAAAGNSGVVKASATTNTTQAPAASGSSVTMASATDVGRSHATDAPDGGLLDIHKQKQLVLMDSLRHKGLDAQREAAEKFRTGQYDEAVAILQSYLDTLEEQQLEAPQRAQLKRPVDARLSQYRLLKTQRELAAGAINARKSGQERVDATRRAEEMKRQNVDKLMKEFNDLFKEGKYLEAESIAMKASDLDPDNGIISAAVYMARRQRDIRSAQKSKDSRERMFLTGANDAEDEGPAGAVTEGETFPDKATWASKKNRKPLTPITLTHPSEKEKAIMRRLSTPVSLSFEDAPLKAVINELRDVNGINIVIDDPALQEQGISLESPISIKLDQVSLKSALNLILHKVHLTHVVKDEALQITTEEHAKGKLTTVTYQVADLVIPVENFGDVRTPPPPLYAPSNPNPTAPAPTPVTPGPFSMGGGAPVGSSSYNSPGTSPLTSSGPTTQVQRRSANNTLEDQLIKLITNTIQPHSWSDAGGPGTIDYHPLTMALVINQAADIQEQISELLAALRRLQDQEVAVEVRLISVTEDFFERVGVNFNLNIPTNNTKFQPELLNNSFVVDSTRFINAFQPSRALLGLTPAGSLTSDLNIPFGTQSFFSTVPAFGGYTAGGLTMGLAFLSDIQVFLFMEAIQGDQRANIMQAPKLTLFNGQTASLTVTETGSFVQGVQVVSLAGGAQYSLVPTITPVAIGVSLTIQAVITADRRFVRLSLAPTLTNQLPGAIGTFPLVVPVFTAFDGTQTGQPVVFTQFIQQPNFTSVGVLTTVAVPDGGTVLMGGLKRLSEARSEYGPPILSKIPVIDRLFKNVGYGRDTESLLIMVTPRIIIQEEEEERQTGYREVPPPGLP
jgi:type II secretory pathway component GspD/PulD (secretin)